MVFDALEQPIEVGKKYGYSSRTGSWVTITAGVATKINDSGRATLEVLSAKRYLYGGEFCDCMGTKTVTTSSFLLFPINGQANLNS